MITENEAAVFDLLDSKGPLDTDGVIRWSAADPVEVPRTIGALMKKGMVRVHGYHRDGRDKVPHFGVA